MYNVNVINLAMKYWHQIFEDYPEKKLVKNEIMT